MNRSLHNWMRTFATRYVTRRAALGGIASVAVPSMTKASEQRGSSGTDISPSARHVYESVSGMSTTEVPAEADTLRVQGYSTAGDGGEALYRRVSEAPSTAGRFQSADGAWWELDSWPVNFAMFGADMSGKSVADDAFSACLDYVTSRRTSPSGHPGYGQDCVVLPKGILKLTRTYSPQGLVSGLTIRGASKYASAIEFHNDVAPLFDLTANTALTLSHLSLIHVPGDKDRSTWTNSIVTRSGISGGNELHFDNIYTRNWNIIDKNTGKVNNDTTRFTFCRLRDPRTVIYGRSSQSVVNKFDQCTIVGKVEKILDVAGYGYTVFDTCNLVVDGTWISLADSSGRYGNTSTLVFRSTKGEPYNSYKLANGSISRLLVVENASPFVTADVVFENTGFSSGVTLDPRVNQISVTPTVRVRWSGGDLMTTAKIETIAGSYEPSPGHTGILFEEMRSVPMPANVIRTADSGGRVQPSITWKNCRNMVNISSAGQLVHVRDARQVNDLLLDFTQHTGSTNVYALPFHGLRQRVIEIVLYLESKQGSHVTVALSSDEGRAIESMVLTSRDNTPYPLIRRFNNAVDVFASEGLFFEVVSMTEHRGFIRITHEAA